MECLVPPPDGYQPPIRWPKSKSECWYRNVPYDWINKEKSNQHWLQKDGEKKFIFPGGGTMFPDGVTKYVDSMVDLIPGMKDGTIRTAIDTGCGNALSQKGLKWDSKYGNEETVNIRQIMSWKHVHHAL
ncbi:PREDICTED: probable methyltransferase PMT21 [Ipomoea nil]|uniref:probable methyltransferase PMT21 n=1 Tax=Ipomoea nil TaxID=35883 RepID=UPI00090151CF|nr:PREDICTED: probable methyltransferase PMT21 [Ipomoea nil]